MTIYITLTTPTTDAGPFNLYSNVDGFVSAFASNISKATLSAGYSATVPNGTTIVRAVSVGELCTNYLEFPVFEACPTENVYLILGFGELVSFNPDTGNVTFLQNLPGSPDVAMTNSKLFVLTFSRVLHEYDITLNPWSATFVRTINFPTYAYGAGLEAVSNTKLLVGGSKIYEADISGITPVFTELFTVPSGGQVTGDIYYNPYDNIIFITYGTGSFGTNPCFIAKFTYSGTLIGSGPLPNGKLPYGMYAYNDELYVINSDGSIYFIDSNTLAYTFDSQITTSSDVYGAAQPLSCRNNIIPV